METTYSDMLVKRSTPFGWVILFFAAIFYFYEFWLQVSPGVMAPDIMQHYGVSGSELAFIATFYFIGYAGMQLPAGMLFDKFGPRKLLCVATLCCAVGTLIFATASHFQWLLLARFITGLGSSFAFLGALVLAANWFPPRRFAMLNGATVTLGMFGAIFGEKPLALMVNALGWQKSMLYLGIAGFALALVLFLVIRDRPKGMREQHKPVNGKELLSSLWYIIKHPKSWLVALYGALMYGPTPAFAFWGVYFMMLAHHLARTDAAELISLIFFGWAIGAPILGAFSDKVGKRKTPMLISAIGGILFILPVIYSPISNKWLLGSSMFIFGFFSSGFLPSYALIREIHSRHICGTVMGFMNTLNNIGGALLPPAIGLVLDHYWQGQTLNNLRIYPIADYHLALTILPVCMIVALLLLPFLPETYCRMLEDK